MELVYIGLENSWIKHYTAMTIGKKYHVSNYRNSLGPDVYILTNDKGKLITMSKDCFMSVSEFRDKKLEILWN